MEESNLNTFTSTSSESGSGIQNPLRLTQALTERWPILSRAIGRYQQGTASHFTQAAYEHVSSGIIRHDDRQKLAALARDLDIRPFDAQLLIACAVRQWSLDHRYDGLPVPDAPALSPEHRAWVRVWRRLALIAITAAALDGIILWKWLF